MGGPRIRDLFTECLGAIGANKLRSALTLLGIVIGVSSVILTIALGETTRSAVTRSLEALGTNLVIVFSGSANVGGVRAASGTLPTLTLADVEALREVPEISSASAVVVRPMQVIAPGTNTSTTVVGVQDAYFDMLSLKMAEGDALTAADVRGAAHRAVVGPSVKKALFGSDDALGQEVRINRVPFVVEGVLRARGRNLAGQDEDDVVLVPLSTAQRVLYGPAFASSVQLIVAQAASRDTIPAAEQAITTVLRERHHVPEGAPDDFSVKSTLALGEATQSAARLLSVLLGSIASISLVVGGIGIMNVMLVSVAERTKEIGIRIAVGAKERHILSQFLFESVLLSCIGGALGVALALFTAGLTRVAFAFPLEVSWQAIALAFLVSSAVGVIFGIYPARRAARLDPIAALRSE